MQASIASQSGAKLKISCTENLAGGSEIANVSGVNPVIVLRVGVLNNGLTDISILRDPTAVF